MTARCPERIAAGLGYARCHRPPGHRGRCHAAGRSWFPAGDEGQRLRLGVGCFHDCIPLPGPYRATTTTARTRRTATRRRTR
jgi:hypothetical protein